MTPSHKRRVIADGKPRTTMTTKHRRRFASPFLFNALITLGLLISHASQAQTARRLYSTYSGGGDYETVGDSAYMYLPCPVGCFYQNAYAAVPFTPQYDAYLGSITAPFNVSNGSGIQIRTDDGANAPSSTVLDSASLPIGAIANRTIEFSGYPFLKAGTKYWAFIYRTSGGAGGAATWMNTTNVNAPTNWVSIGSTTNHGAIIVTEGFPPPMPVIFGARTNRVYLGQSITYTAAVTNDTPTPLLQWTLNGVDIPGATNLVLALPPQANVGTYVYSFKAGNVTATNTTLTRTLIVAPVNARAITPIAHWHFDELPGSTIAGDSTTNGFIGTLSATGAAFIASTRSGNALSLSRTNGGFVTMGNVLPLTNADFTIALWMQSTDTVYSTLLGKRIANQTNGYAVAMNNTTGFGAANKASLYTSTPTSSNRDPRSTTGINDGQWHQVVAIHRGDGSQNQIFVDGSPVEASTTANVILTNDAAFCIGAILSNGVPAASYTGLIDEVQIFDRALNNEQIDYLFTDAASTNVAEPDLPTNFFTWGSAVNGTWDDSSKWIPYGVPGSNDVAVVTNTGNFTVTVDAPVTVSNLSLGTGPVSATNTLTLTSTLTVRDTLEAGPWASLNQNNTLTIQKDFINEGLLALSTTFNVTNSFVNRGAVNWDGGTIRGTGVIINETNGTFLTRQNNPYKYLGANFINRGVFTVGSSDLRGVRFQSNAAFTNEAGAEIRLASPGLGFLLDSGTSTLYNFGSVRAQASGVFDPAYVSIDFLNFGTLSLETAYTYLARGTNYGAISCNAANRYLSTVDTDPFVFESGTTFSSPGPLLYAGGKFVFNTPLSLNSSTIYIGGASGGAKVATPSVTFNANFTFNGEFVVAGGHLIVTNPAVTVDANQITMTDDNTTGNPTAYCTNAATILVNTYAQGVGTSDNAGTITIRTNLSFTGGNFRSAGIINLAAASSSSISGGGSKSISGQQILNYSAVSSQAAASFVGNALWRNFPGSTLTFAAGSFTTGPGTFLNQGTIQGYGGISGNITTTNSNLIIADDSLNRTLTISSLFQTSGETRLRRGILAGNVNILGGELNGTNQITGSLYNTASFNAGNPLGLLTLSGNYTNTSAGVEQMRIQTNAFVPGRDYTQVRVSGTAYLAGTFNVTFANGFFPTIGNTYTAMTWTAHSGVFDQIVTPNYQFQILYTATNLLLTASNALPNISMTVAGGNTQVVCQPFKVTASATDLDGTITNISLYLNGSLATSASGASVSSTFEQDFPGTNIFEARALDNRGGESIVTQQVVQVTMPLHVLTLGGIRATNTFKFCMLGEEGRSYEVLANTNLNTTNWDALGVMENTNGIWRFIDTNNISDFPQHYYKARQLP